MKRIIALVALALFFTAALPAEVNSTGGHEPPGNSGECHGKNDIPCREDPQPDHGKDCEAHGKNPDGNDDHCDGTPEPTETPKPTKTPEPTTTPEPTKTPEPTPSPTPSLTPEPTVEPTPEPREDEPEEQEHEPVASSVGPPVQPEKPEPPKFAPPPAGDAGLKAQSTN